MLLVAKYYRGATRRYVNVVVPLTGLMIKLFNGRLSRG